MLAITSITLKRAMLVLVVLALSAGLAYSAAYAQEEPEGYKLLRPEVSEETGLQGKEINILDSKMYFVEQGQGEPVIFIHGNPTSSYLWRNVMPYVSVHGRAIAIDLIGMGRSGKSPEGYRYKDHYAYLEAFIDELGLTDITFVLHDWGATLGFDYARLHPERVRRVAFMEGVLPPVFPQPGYDSMGEEMGQMFKALKDPVKGREMVIDNNLFVEEVLPTFVNRPLGQRAMEEYRRPYLDPADREPVLEWPRELPIAGEPEDVVVRMEAIGGFMSTTDMPVLLLYAEPGVVVSPETAAWYVENMRNIETAFVGQGFHYIQEDHPDAIGRALADWIRRN